MQFDNRPCVKFEDGFVHCLGDNDTEIMKKAKVIHKVDADGNKYDFETTQLRWKTAEIYKGCELRVAESAATPGFWWAAASMIGTFIYDAESTRWILRNHPESHELNPIYGRRPSGLRIYGTGMPITVLEIWGMYKIKQWPDKKGIRDRMWVAIPVVNDALHIFAGSHNFSGCFTCRGLKK